MRNLVSFHLSAGLLIVAAGMTSPSLAQTACNHLIDKQITLRGTVISSRTVALGGSGFDFIVIRSSDPACGTVQMGVNQRTCRVGSRYSATGKLTSGAATRSGGNKQTNAADYAFEADNNNANHCQ